MSQFSLIPLTGAHMLMTVLPGAAVAFIMARAGVKSVPMLLGALLAATGAAAMLTFWAFYATPDFGKVVAFCFQGFSIVAVVWALHDRRIDRTVLIEIGIPLLLWVLGTYFLVFLGFLHGGANHAEGMGATRFNVQLPSDNDIPQYFTSWFYENGHHGTPPLYPGDWSAADRPPLQIGYELMQRPFGWDTTGLNYDLIGVIIQQLWIVGLWALLKAFKIGRLTASLAMVTVLVSDVAIVNGFFVWPKMIAAAMVLGAAAVMITAEWGPVRRSYGGAIIVASLCALAMLAHGGSAFGLIPLVVVALIRGRPSWRWILVGLAVAAVLYVPWSEYQKHGDPPGDRVTVWQLAGSLDGNPNNTPPSLLTAVRHAYGQAGLGTTVHNKVENYATMVGGGPMVSELHGAWDQLKAGSPSGALDTLRSVLFVYPLPSLGPLVLVPFLMLLAWWRRRRGPARALFRTAEWSAAAWMYLTMVIGYLAWGLILFGNSISRTVNHQGTFALPVLGFAAGVLGIRAMYPRFGVWFVGICAAVSLAIFVPMLEPSPDTRYSAAAAVICALCLAGFLLCALRIDPRRLDPRPFVSLPKRPERRQHLATGT